MTYDLQLLPEAIEDLAYWKRSGEKKVLKKSWHCSKNSKCTPKPVPASPKPSKVTSPVCGADALTKEHDSFIPSTKRPSVCMCSPCEGITATNSSHSPAPHSEKKQKKRRGTAVCHDFIDTHTARHATQPLQNHPNPKSSAPECDLPFHEFTKRSAAHHRSSTISISAIPQYLNTITQ